MTERNPKSKAYGTREWATKTVNCCTGCSHDCRYCYARGMAVRFKRMNPGDWHREQIRERDVFKRAQKISWTGDVSVLARHHGW